MYRIKQINARVVNTLIEHAKNKNFIAALFILEHNTSRHNGKHEEHKSKNLGKYQKAFWAIFEHN